MAINVEAPPDRMAAQRHAAIAELQEPAPPQTLPVGEGDCVDADIDHSFASKGFRPCSALIVHSPRSDRYGLFHIYPGQRIDDEHGSPLVASLRRLLGASAILVDGSESTSKKRILGDLYDFYAISVINHVSFTTIRSNEEEGYAFHVVFRPRQNEVLIARISHRDVLSFKAF